MRVVLIRNLDLREFDSLPELDVIPSVRHDVQVIVSACSDPIFALLDFIGNEESNGVLLFILEILLALLCQSVTLVKYKELRVKDLGVIVYNDPERFALAIPAIVPSEVRDYVQLNFEDGSCDW